MIIKTILYNKIEAKFFLNPGLFLSEDDLILLRDDLFLINKSSGRNLNYGIYNNDFSFFKEAMKTMLVCVFYNDKKPIGSFYNYIIHGKEKIVHQGLVILSENPGFDLLKIPYMMATLILHKNIGSFYITNISNVPKIIGEIAYQYKNVWPSPQSDLSRPPVGYVEILSTLDKEYVRRFFPMPEYLTVDFKRFVLKANTKEIGFETDLTKLPKHSKLEANLFSMFWIDYNKNEDLIQVGLFDEELLEYVKSFFIKNNIQLSF